MDVVKRLITSRRFWLAALAVVVQGASSAFPQIPASVVDGFRVFCLALIAAYTVEDSAKALASR